jgi:hypothetical protein
LPSVIFFLFLYHFLSFFIYLSYFSVFVSFLSQLLFCSYLLSSFSSVLQSERKVPVHLQEVSELAPVMCWKWKVIQEVPYARLKVSYVTSVTSRTPNPPSPTNFPLHSTITNFQQLHRDFSLTLYFLFTDLSFLYYISSCSLFLLVNITCFL